MENKKYLTVTALNKYLAYKIDTDINLRRFIIQGEISNARFSKGHLYFVLKDDESEISAIMFSNFVEALDFEPKDGIKVLATCSLSLYQKKGTYNLQVTSMKEDGLGLLYQNFLKLKEKLFKEGLFASEHKKKIPEYPENIGLITSSTGDAMHDVVSTISKRFPLVNIYLYPVLVQGEDAPLSIIKALQKANYDKKVDVIIIARGGGSIEDLSCFNDEGLAREIYNSEIPIISGVGHEADYTICDFVSDERAPTPTGAAVRAVKDKTTIIQDLNSINIKIKTFMKKIFDKKDNEYTLLTNNYFFKNFDVLLDRKIEQIANLEKLLITNSPIGKIKYYEDNLNYLNERIIKYDIVNRIDTFKSTIDDCYYKINDLYNKYLNNLDNNINASIEKMIILNPMNLMLKGYSLTYQENKLITKVDDIDLNKDIVTKISDGEIESKIINVKRNK